MSADKEAGSPQVFALSRLGRLRRLAECLVCLVMVTSVLYYAVAPSLILHYTRVTGNAPVMRVLGALCSVGLALTCYYIICDFFRSRGCSATFQIDNTRITKCVGPHIEAADWADLRAYRPVLGQLRFRDGRSIYLSFGLGAHFAMSRKMMREVLAYSDVETQILAGLATFKEQVKRQERSISRTVTLLMLLLLLSLVSGRLFGMMVADILASTWCIATAFYVVHILVPRCRYEIRLDRGSD